jgi:hypothetical protein
MGIKTIATAALYRRGIDPRQLKALLSVYIKQDIRGDKGLLQSSKSDYIKSNWSLLTMLVIYLAMGIFMSLLAFAGLDVFFYSLVVLSFTLFLVATSIVTESGNVIFNESEADVIGHLPISPRTLFAAKVTSLFLFTLMITAAANLFPALCGVFAEDSNLLFAPAHALSASLTAMFATACVTAVYGLLMRYVSKERFDNIVAYTQVVFMLIFMFSFQVIPRVADEYGIIMTGEFQWYYLLFPPAWFSGVTMLLMGNFDLYSLALAALSAVSLLALVALALRKVAAGYSSFVSQLAYGTDKPASRQAATSAARGLTGRRLLSSIKLALLRRPAERAVFDLVSVYLRRNREIKIRLYPSLAYVIMFPLIGAFGPGFPDPFTDAGGAFTSLMGMAMIGLVALTVIEGLAFCEHYHAAYIFNIAPIESVGAIHGGIRKAIFTLVTLPAFALLLIFYSVAWRSPAHALLVIAPWIAITPPMLLIPFLFRRFLPLSRKYRKGEQSARNITIMLISFFCLSALMGLQTLGLMGIYPYWLFLASIAVGSPLAYFIIRKLTRESMPLPPADSLA